MQLICKAIFRMPLPARFGYLCTASIRHRGIVGKIQNGDLCVSTRIEHQRPDKHSSAVQLSAF